MRSQSQEGQLELWEREPSVSQSSGTSSALESDKGSPFPFPAASLKRALASDFAKKRPLHVLVADDNKINRKVIRVILEKLGYPCSEAENGEEALKLFKSEMFDYIFMDLDMPEVTGIEAAKSIRSLEHGRASEEAIPESEIIAVTANVSSETRLKCRRAGMNGYLEKPVTAQMIKDQLLRSWPRIRSRRARLKTERI